MSFRKKWYNFFMEKEVLTIDERQRYEDEITRLKNLVLLQKSEIEYWKKFSNMSNKEKYSVKAEASQG